MIILGIDTSNYTTSLSLVSEDGFLHVRKILDVKKGECGLEIEVVTFQGEKLPKLPSAAKLVIRSWDPQTDEPLLHASSLKIPAMM